MASPSSRIEVYDTYSKGLVLRVAKTGRKTFVFRFRMDGKHRRMTIGEFPDMRLSKARSETADLKYKVRKGVNPQGIKKKDQKKNFAYLAGEFKDKHFPKLRESTKESYGYVIDNILLPEFGTTELKNISKHDIISMLDRKAYKDNSPALANKTRSVLSKIFNFAVKRDLAKNNLVSLTPTYKEGRNSRDRYYSEDEIIELWDYFNNIQEITGSILKILLVCGQRKTETMRIRWDDISDNNKTWTIPADIAKNNQSHQVPLSELAVSIITNLKPYTGDKTYVFSSPKKQNEPILNLSRHRYVIKRQTSVSDFRIHDLRRTMATYMAKIGVSRVILGKLLNHKGLSGDDHVTAIYDRHSYMREKRQAMGTWSEKLLSILN